MALQMTNYVMESAFWEANSHSGAQKFPLSLRFITVPTEA
jgi:hypothetical protein